MHFSYYFCAHDRRNQKYHSSHSNWSLYFNHRYLANIRLSQRYKPLLKFQDPPLAALIEDYEQRIEQIKRLDKNQNKTIKKDLPQGNILLIPYF